MRFLNSRRIVLVLVVIALVMGAIVGGIGVYLNSPAFKDRAQQYIVQEIEGRTGAAVTLKNFEWSFWHRRFRLDDLTLRGLETAEEAPLAHFKRIDVGLNLRMLVEKKIDLFELTFSGPEFHIVVGPDGRTNIPSPPAQPGRNALDFEISIKNFNVIGGSALLNERRINLNFSTQSVAAVLNYHGPLEALETHIRYDGILDRSSQGQRSIPYTVAADADYTRATLVAHKIAIASGLTALRLQGRINQLLSRNISGKLEYSGNVQVPFLNYFYPADTFGGKADVAGFMEFASGYFSTQGDVLANAVDFNGWHAGKTGGEYAYRYPEKRLSVHNMKTVFGGGSATGDIVVENLPGPARTILNLAYSQINSAALQRAYPWDPKFRVFSNLTGTLDGWFEGRLSRFEFGGHADLARYTAPPLPDVVPLPLDGSADYQLSPGQARVANAEVRLYSTMAKAEGLIHPTTSDLKVDLVSSNLKDIVFVYAGANGEGAFNGRLTGRISKPVFDGEFTLANFVFHQWKIQEASGGARLDTVSEAATLRNVRITYGESELLVNGNTTLSGSTADLRVQSSRLTAQDVRPFVNRNVDGTFAGDVRIAALYPLVKLEGDVRADNLSIDNHAIGNARAHVRSLEPVVEIDQLTIRRNDATLTGNVTFNRANDALKFSALINSIDLETFYAAGLPDVVHGVIRQANVRGEGTIKQPNISGSATIQNLSVYGEVFPQAEVELASLGSKLDVKLNTGNNISLTAQLDTAATGYPFTAQARFKQYPVERLARVPGTITATGNMNLSGLLTDRTRLIGQGQIEAANLRLQDVPDIPLQTTKPFTFDFNSDRLNLIGVTLKGEATQVNVAGAIAFKEQAPLNLDVGGQVDLALLSAATPDWRPGGSVNVQVGLRGTPQMPDIRGVAHINNGSFRREGFFTSLTNVNGDLFFARDQVNFSNIAGQVSGGTVRAQGAATLERGGLQAMNIHIDADNVRFRYPEGLRTVVDAALDLRGNWAAPRLEGRVQIQNLAYRSSFEEFLALLTERYPNLGPSPASRLQLALHIEGSRNITIQNALADVEARVDVDLKGTLAEPSLTGHVEASGGTLVFQGNRYTVTRGNIDFVDPIRIEPVVDIEAESQVRDYRVILAITGRGNRLRLTMRSDPPLPELEIVSLIAGGRTREEIAGFRATPTSEQLFQSGAASILFDLLQQRVGNRLGVLGTGTRVRLDPFLVGAENNPGARITLSEQVTKELSITYSQDLSSNRQQVILIEYFISRNTSIQASRDELGNFGLDVRLRRRIK